MFLRPDFAAGIGPFIGRCRMRDRTTADLERVVVRMLRNLRDG